MTGAHLESIQMLFPNAAEKAFLLREFEEPGTTVWRDVPDPIGSSREVYLHCAATIKNALPSVLAFVEQTEVATPAIVARRRQLPPTLWPTCLLTQRRPAAASGAQTGGGLRKTDPEIFDTIQAEEKRQREKSS